MNASKKRMGVQIENNGTQKDCERSFAGSQIEWERTKMCIGCIVEIGTSQFMNCAQNTILSKRTW